MAGQPEKAYVEGEPMEGAIREMFPGVQMGKMMVEGKAFKNTNPNILEITYIGPVSHGPRFFERLSELVKRQLGESNDNKDRYERIVMEDDQGNIVTAYFDREGTWSFAAGAPAR